MARCLGLGISRLVLYLIRNFLGFYHSLQKSVLPFEEAVYFLGRSCSSACRGFSFAQAYPADHQKGKLI